MVARTQPYNGHLVVTFQRDGEEPESMFARDPSNAWEHGIYLLSQHQELRHGDILTVRRSDEGSSATVLPGPGGDLPATERAQFALAGASRSPHPFVIQVGTGFIPYIHHPDRSTPYLCVERFRRKAKASPDEALAYAARVIWHRQRRPRSGAASKRSPILTTSVSSKLRSEDHVAHERQLQGHQSGRSMAWSPS